MKYGISDIDKEQYRNRKIVLELYHKVLFPYIANANEADVIQKIYEWLNNGQITLISKDELKASEYLASLATRID